MIQALIPLLTGMLSSGTAAGGTAAATGGSAGGASSILSGLLGGGGGGGMGSFAKAPMGGGAGEAAIPGMPGRGGGGAPAGPSVDPVIQKGMQDAYERGMSAQNLLTQITSKDTIVDKLLRERIGSRVR